MEFLSENSGGRESAASRRTELTGRCGVILALQTSRAVHLGVDNLGVVRHVGRLLSGCRDSKPFELVNDGDLLLLVDRILQRRGLDCLYF